MLRERNADGASSHARAAQALPDSIDHPLLRFAPVSWTPYIQLARLDRPAGWQLLLAPCWQSSALAAAIKGDGPYYAHLLLFLIGAIAMRGAGCTYNDLVDREIDAKVSRTAMRPLPSGRVTPRAAKIFLACQCLLGLAVLLCFNAFTIFLGFSSLAIVLIYPYMKRVTSWPQAVLGCAFAWGGLMGYAAIFASLGIPAALLYASAILWTIGYDTIYAMQDARDDAIIGVRSTARLFGDNARSVIAGFYGAAVVLALAATLCAGVGWPAYLGLCAYGAHLMQQVYRLPPIDDRQALKLFRSNRDAGFLLFAGFFVAALLG